MKELKLNLLDTSFAPFPPRRDLDIKKNWDYWSWIFRNQNPFRPGILSDHKPGLLEPFLAAWVEVVPVFWFVELDQDRLHRVVDRAFFPTTKVLNNSSCVFSMFFCILCIWCCSCSQSHRSLSSVSVRAHLFWKDIRLKRKRRDLKKKTQPEVVVICHLLLDPIGLKAVEEKRPGNDKGPVLDTTGEIL